MSNDLWWLIKNDPFNYSVQHIVNTISEYREHVPYEQIRYRLLDWSLSSTDEGFETLIEGGITIEQVRTDLREFVNDFEAEVARDIKARRTQVI